MGNVFLVPAIVMSGSTPSTGDLSTFTGFADALLSWLVTTMGTILEFLLAHPIALVSIVLSLIVAAIGMIFNILKGR